MNQPTNPMQNARHLVQVPLLQSTCLPSIHGGAMPPGGTKTISRVVETVLGAGNSALAMAMRRCRIMSWIYALLEHVVLLDNCLLLPSPYFSPIRCY